MAVIRCLQCGLPMTDQEARTGTCPACAASLPGANQASTRAAPASSVAQSSSARPWIFCGGLSIFLLGLGLLLFYNMPGKPAPPKDAEVAAMNLPPLPGAPKSVQPAVKDSKAEQPPKEQPKKEEPKKEEPKKDEPKKEEPKKEEPKKVEPKKEDAKKEEPKVVRKPDDEKPPERKPAPQAKPQRLAILPFVPHTAIKIDGDLAEWKALLPLLLNPAELGRAPKNAVLVPKAQEAYAAYCSKGILIAVDIIDPSGDLENAGKPDKGMWPFWFNDAVEVYIDTLNKRPDRRGDESAHQFFALPFGAPGEDGIGGYESRILRNRAGREDWNIIPHRSTGDMPMLRAAQKTRAGWTMELLIPRSAMRGDIRAGETIGFELQIDTGTNVFFFWAADNPRGAVSMHPSLWGEALLAGTDARLEMLDPDSKPAKILAPGQPLTVRVTDADANFEPLKKDRLGVTLRGKGDVKTLVLEESDVDSGVFVGTIALQKDAAPRRESFLLVQDDDNVVVEYVDRVRGNGERDVPLRANITSAREK